MVSNEEPSEISRDGPDPGLRAAFETASNGGPGRYQMIGEIARGGVGVVLKGRDPDLGRDVAMKVLQAKHGGNAAMVQRFVEEAQIAGQLQHPGILPVYELGLREDRRPYFTMKLVKGRTLTSLLQERRDTSVDRARYLGIFEDVCQTIAYAHTRGVIHRDLKPSNIMVGAFGEVQVVDWGLAKVLAQGGIADERRAREKEDDDTVIETIRSGQPGTQSMAGSVMGTPAYMAPEQARGSVELVDERSDVFALGGILCEILTGEPPFVGKGPELMDMVTAGRLEPAFDRLDACGADPELIALARSCLAAERDHRPRSARAVADGITSHLAALSERARASELALIEAKTRAEEERRRRRLTVGLAAAVLLAVLTASFSFIKLERDRADRIATATRQVNDALQSAQFALGQAQKAPVHETEIWTHALGEAQQLRDIRETAGLDRDSRAEVDAFLAVVERADRDRLMRYELDEIVIFGATHFDGESWTRMAASYEQAFRDYGIDLLELSDDEIARRLRDSDITADLVNGFELWLGTCFNLRSFGIERYDEAKLVSMIPILYDADDDPFRTQVRRSMYELMAVVRGAMDPKEMWGANAGAMPPDVVAARAKCLEELRVLAASDECAEALPLTQSWLAFGAAFSGDPELADPVYQNGLLHDPDSFMLTFDYTHHLKAKGTPEALGDAITYYRACLAIRPRVPGIWRTMGMVYHELGRTGYAISALERSIEIQSEHAPTHTDLAIVLAASDRLDEAIDAYREAARLRPDDPARHMDLGEAYMAAGRPADALAAFGDAQQLRPEEALQTKLSDLMRQCLDRINERKD